MSELQVLPIVRVDARYGRIGGKYPERVRIAMADGTTQWYRIEVNQPAPFVREALDRFDNMIVGYERAGDAATSTGPRTKLITNYSITEKGI